MKQITPRKLKILLLTAYCLLLTVFVGCASLLQKENILAVVDGEPITEEDLKYSLNVAHRKEDLSSAGALNLSQYIQKLIDDRLIIDEARRMGMDQYPDVQQAIQAYILRESVVRLHDEEIVQKVSVTEKDVMDYYNKNYERFTIGFIEVKSEEEAREILEQLRMDGNFREIAQKYSTHASKKDGGEIVLTRNSMPSFIEEAVSSLKPEEFSDVIKAMNKYYIVKLIGRKEAPDEELERVKGNIERAIRKQKETERSDEYLKHLHEQATIKIDREVLSSIKLSEGAEEIEKWLKDKRTLVEINIHNDINQRRKSHSRESGNPERHWIPHQVRNDGQSDNYVVMYSSVLTVGDFVAMVAPYSRKSSEDILNRWIDRKIVDHEALSRHYEMKPGLKEMVYRYENQLFKNTFIKSIIIPRIVISDKTLEDYYLKHQKSFIRPAQFKIQQITVKTMDEAQEVLNNLQNGADFSWLAKRRSADSAASKGGDAGWVTKAELPAPVKEIIDSFKIGDVSPIIKIDSLYRIVRLEGKTDEGVKAFNEVKNAVYSAYFNEQINTMLDKYVNQLKADAQIKIYDREIRTLEEKLQR